MDTVGMLMGVLLGSNILLWRAWRRAVRRADKIHQVFLEAESLKPPATMSEYEWTAYRIDQQMKDYAAAQSA